MCERESKKKKIEGVREGRERGEREGGREEREGEERGKEERRRREGGRGESIQCLCTLAAALLTAIDLSVSPLRIHLYMSL